MARQCPDYVASQYRPAAALGSVNADQVYNQDLTRQTFADESFDIVVTQDVFEHLMEPGRAIAEIARTLRVGGAHIMTVPIVRGGQPSRRRAHQEQDKVIFDLPAEYHGNPVSSEGALVMIDWGYDIADYLTRHSGLPTTIFNHHDFRYGLAGEYLDVVVSRKGVAPSL